MAWLIKLEYRDDEGRHVEETRRLGLSIDSGDAILAALVSDAAAELHAKANRQAADAVLTLAWLKEGK